MAKETPIEITPKLGGVFTPEAEDKPSKTKPSKTAAEEIVDSFSDMAEEDLYNEDAYDVEDDIDTSLPDLEELADDEAPLEEEEPVEEEEDGGEDSTEALETPEAPEDTAPKKIPRSEKRIKTLIAKMKRLTAIKDQELIDKETQYLNVIQELQERVALQESELAGVLTDSAEKRINAAKSKLRAAKDAMDSDAEMEALEELQEAKYAKVQADDMVKRAPKIDPEAKGTKAPAVDRRVVASNVKTGAWVAANKTLVENPTIASVISTIAKGVEQEGYEPFDDVYYDIVTERLNERLSKAGINVRARSLYDNFIPDDYTYDEEEETPPMPPKEPVKPAKKPINPAGGTKQPPSNMTKGAKVAPTKVRVEKEELQMLRTMNVDPENYLRQKALRLRGNVDTNGSRLPKGYTPVFIPSKKR